MEALVLQDYFRRCPTGTSEGLFSLSLGYIQVDTPLDVEEIQSALAELSRIGLYDYDADTEVLLDRTALRNNPLRNGVNKKTGEISPDKRITHAVRAFEGIPDSMLKLEFLALADLYSRDLADAIREASPYDYSSPSKAPSEPSLSPSEGASREEKSSKEESREEDSKVDTDAVEFATKAFGADVVRVVGDAP